MDKPTLSPQSNRLLEMCQGVLTATNSPDELSTLLEEMYEGLEKAKNDFVAQVQKQGEEYISKMETEMNLVISSFDHYQAGLDQISRFFMTNNRDDISQGMDVIIQATNEILDTLTVYESKSLQMGPTSFPILNMLILLSDGFKKGDVSEDEFRFMIYNAGQYFEKLADEARKYEGEEAKNAINTLKEGYEKFIDGLGKLDEGAKATNELMIDDALEIIRQSQEIIKAGYAQFNEEMFLAGPTESPWVNLIISTIKGVKEGTFPKELLSENLEKYQEHMDALRADVEGVAAIPIESEDITNELPNTIRGLDLSDEACDLIRTYIQDGNAAHLEPAVEKLKESAAVLKGSQKKYEEVGEREGKIACIRCGALNEPTNNMCTKCGAVLPKVVGEAVGVSTFAVGETGEMGAPGAIEFVMTENVKKIVDESAKVRDGKITFEEYSKTLDWMDNMLKQGLATADSTPTINIEAFPEEEREAAIEQKKIAEETISLLKEAIHEFMDAIAELRRFGEDGDIQHLRTGLEMTVESSTKLYQVQKIGELAAQEMAKAEAGVEGEAEEVAERESFTSSESEESETLA